MTTNIQARILAITILLASTIGGCGDHHHGHEGHEEPSGTAMTGLKLNDGKKWPMDAHTRSVIQTMQKRLEASDQKPKQLGAEHQDDLKKLIDGCTMTGASHDELHKFLIHFMPATRELSKTGSDASLERVTHLLHVYPNYFE